MPTFVIEVREKNKRRDDKYPVSIRLTHQRSRKIIPTDVYVTRKQIKPDFSGLKDTTIIRRLLEDISNYEDILIKGLGTDLSRYTAQDLVNYITTQKTSSSGMGIDFIAFSKTHIQTLKDAGRNGYAGPFEVVIRNLMDYFGRSVIFIKEINVKNLQGFIEYMQKPRTLVRINQHGSEVKVEKKGCSPQTVKDYLGDIQTLFNAAREKFNDEDSGILLITHNPFGSQKLRVEVRREPQKRDLSVDDLVKILKAESVPGHRMQLARDVLALSFYLVAINTVDMFGSDVRLTGRRITYRRQKTTTRRKDEALISIKIEPEALPLIRKYWDADKTRLFSFYKMYGNYKYFNKNVNAGCAQLAKYLGIEANLTTYYMRHTLATIASEDCGISDGDIAIMLNHIGDDFESGKSLKITRGYIHRRFTRIDESQRQVLDFVKSKY